MTCWMWWCVLNSVTCTWCDVLTQIANSAVIRGNACSIIILPWSPWILVPSSTTCGSTRMFRAIWESLMNLWRQRNVNVPSFSMRKRYQRCLMTLPMLWTNPISTWIWGSIVSQPRGRTSNSRIWRAILNTELSFVLWTLRHTLPGWYQGHSLWQATNHALSYPCYYRTDDGTLTMNKREMVDYHRKLLEMIE